MGALRDLRDRIGSHLVAIEDELANPAYKLTLIARHESNPRAHIILTVDDLSAACDAAMRTEADPQTSTVPASAGTERASATPTDQGAGPADRMVKAERDACDWEWSSAVRISTADDFDQRDILTQFKGIRDRNEAAWIREHAASAGTAAVSADAPMQIIRQRPDETVHEALDRAARVADPEALRGALREEVSGASPSGTAQAHAVDCAISLNARHGCTCGAGDSGATGQAEVLPTKRAGSERREVVATTDALIASLRPLVVKLGAAEDAFDDAAISGRPYPEGHRLAAHGETEFYFNNSDAGWQAYHELSNAIEHLDATVRAVIAGTEPKATPPTNDPSLSGASSRPPQGRGASPAEPGSGLAP